MKKKLVTTKEEPRITLKQWKKAAPEICENIRRVRLAAEKFQREKERQKK